MIYDILPVNNYRGNGYSTVFDFDFYIDNISQLKVYLFNDDGTKHLLKNNVDYCVSGIKNQNGGNITFPIENSTYQILSQNQKISLELDIPASQETQYNNSSLLNLESLEYSFDYLTRLIQILKRKISLCVKVEECSDNSPEELIEAINSAKIDINSKANQVASNLQTVLDSTQTALEYKESTQNILDDAKEFKKELMETNMFKFALFDMKLSDHLLQGSEATGWALQGSYVSKVDYPDFYLACLSQKQAATITTTTLDTSDITIYKHSNGHKFYDISDKSKVDSYFNTFGIADFYGIDEEQERIYLPRNKYFHQLTCDIDDVNNLPSESLSLTSQASKPLSSLKLLYYCVGNAIVNAADIDAGALVSQMSQKANVFLDNILPSAYFKNNVVSWVMPDYNAGVSTKFPYTVLKDGIIAGNYGVSSGVGRFFVNNKNVCVSQNAVNSTCYFLVAKGDVVTCTSSNNNPVQVGGVYFYPMKGAN